MKRRRNGKAQRLSAESVGRPIFSGSPEPLLRRTKLLKSVARAESEPTPLAVITQMLQRARCGEITGNVPTPYLVSDTIDDLLRDVFVMLRDEGQTVTAKRGECREVTGVLLELTNPRARLSLTESKGTPFSALGEFCWYLSGRGDFDSITYYLSGAYDRAKDADAEGQIAGAYGPRLVGPRKQDQLERVVEHLRARPSTRQAVLQIFDAEDLLSEQRDVPCTCTLQFLVRNNCLHLITYMRSNDAYKGLPHDVFCFTLLQEWIACRLRLDLGGYKQAVGSLHLYESDRRLIEPYLSEGLQSKQAAMPSMPPTDPVGSLQRLLRLEEALRGGSPMHDVVAAESELEGYWADLLRLLIAFRYWKAKQSDEVRAVRDRMISNSYFHCLDRKARQTHGTP